DGGEMRRGRMTAYKKFGLQNALITGDFLFVKAFGIGGKFDAEIVELTADACAALAEGEIRQKRHAFDTAVTHQEYLDIITRTTADRLIAGGGSARSRSAESGRRTSGAASRSFGIPARSRRPAPKRSPLGSSQRKR